MQNRTLAGRYELREVLGRGGMAVVWRGQDRQLARAVAVKTLELSSTAPPGADERFRREARTTAGLSHPNIVTLFDSGLDGETAFLVMELLPGPTLAEQLARLGVLPVSEVISVSQQVCAALGAAHAAGVIHRDIKPANIAYAGDGSVKVLDFGITRILDEITGSSAATVTAAGTVLGTPAYLSPEQAADEPVDGRADLYALGCVMTALLTGSPPFTGSTAMAVLVKQMQEPPVPLPLTRPDVPVGLAALVAQLLAKAPGDRPATAGEVAARLADLDTPDVATRPLSGAIPSVTRVLWSPGAPGPAGPTRQPWSPGSLWVVVALVLLALVVLGAVALVRHGSGSTAADSSHTAGGPSGSVSTTGTPPSSPGTPPPSSPARGTAGTTSSVPTTPQGVLQTVRRAVTAAVQSGDLDPAAAVDLRHRLDDLGRSLDKQAGKQGKPAKPGKPDKHHGLPPDLAHKVDDLVAAVQHLPPDQLSPAGDRLLSGSLATLQRLVAPTR